MSGDVSLDLIGRILREMRAEQRVMRTEQREMRTVLLGLVEQGRHLRDDLELILKAGMGPFRNLRTG